MRPRKPYGTECHLTYDCGNIVVLAGHYIRSSGGSVYLITEVRAVRGHNGRLRLKCLRSNPNASLQDAIVHPLYWYSRNKK